MNQYLSVWSSLEVDPPVMSPRCQQDCGRSVCRRWTRRSRKPYRTYWTPPEPEVPAHVPALFQSPWRNVELLDLLHPLPLLPPAPICSVYGRRLHHPPQPNPTLLLYNSTYIRPSGGAGWTFLTMEDIGHATSKTFHPVSKEVGTRVKCQSSPVSSQFRVFYLDVPFPTIPQHLTWCPDSLSTSPNTN